MSSVCIATVASPDHFSYFIPPFIYTAKLAYPEYLVKVFLHGELKPDIAEFLDKMKSWVDPRFEVVQNTFPKIPHHSHSYNILRFIIPPEHFQDTDFVYITDVDFLIFRHKPTLKKHYFRIMQEIQQPCVMARSAMYRPHRRKVTKKGWKGKYKRMMAGRVFLNWREWNKKTAKIRDKYRRVAEQDTHDNYDKHRFGSYREQDEVILNRICWGANIPTPRVTSKALTGRGLDNLYRDIHLGDFTKDKRAHKHGKLSRRIKDDNIINYVNLHKDKKWLKVREFASQSGTVRESLRRVDKHVKVRGYTL